LASLIRGSSHQYRVTVHPKVEKFIKYEIQESARRETARLFINDLPNYPFLKEEWDLDKIGGMDDTYRVRIGRYRIYYVVDSANRRIKVVKGKTK
jgi:mRNA-degrading endonuclease RelE of RelBE toxin-antitoxin system